MVRYILLALTKFTFFVHHVKDRMITSATCVASVSMVENNGFEPLTLCVQGRCSSQLS